MLYLDQVEVFFERYRVKIALTQMINSGAFPFQTKFFNTEEELENYAMDIDYDTEKMPGLCVGIVIEGTMGDYKVKLRYDDTNYKGVQEKKQQVPTTRLDTVNALDHRPDEDSYRLYGISGFTFLQYLISQEIIKVSDPAAALHIGVLPMKTAAYTNYDFLIGASSMMGMYIVMFFIAPTFRIISMIVQDKELKTREGMKMMGLKDSAYWLSFFVYYLIFFVVLSVIISSICIKFMYTHSSWVITFIYFLLYGIAVFAFAFFLSAFFSRSRVASITGTMLYFATNIVNTLVADSSVSETNKTAASLLPTVAVTLGCSAYVNYEIGQNGVDFDNATQLSNNYRFSTSLIMLAVDTVIYIVLGIYFDNVIPNSEGISKPWYFFLTKEFWTGKSDEDIVPTHLERRNSFALTGDPAEEERILFPDEHFEKVGEDLKRQEAQNDCLKIRLLNKFFDSKHSVADFSVNMYKGQIFALLGPNGAGKTTTISMLSGLLPSSSGSAYFGGLSMFKNMDVTREKLGVCPQHDVLFEFLTPKEHLELFASFKGREDTEAIDRDVREIINDVELADSANMLACNLSGGQKRRLSIGIAFIGNCDMVFLDEPTSGVDLAGRKRLWGMLKKYKAGKVTILTTHYMEEAEELGDRIGIMANGSLKCVGSPLFLKTSYGAGYNLIIDREEVPISEQQTTQDKITAFLNARIEGVKIRKEAGHEVTYFLPKEGARLFKKFFAELDANQKTLKIASYGMTTNTLEEIFLKVARGEDRGNEAVGQKLNQLRYSESMAKDSIKEEHTELDQYCIANEPEKTGCESFSIHFGAIFYKRLLINMRNWMSVINELIVPIILILFGLAMTKIPMYFDSKTRWLNMDLYPTPQSAIINENGYSGDLSFDDLTKCFDKNIHPVKYQVPTTDTVQNALAFDSYLLQNGDVSPVRYSSLFIKTMDSKSKLYEFLIFANITSQDSHAIVVGYYMQSFVRLITKNENFRLQFANAPLPLSYKIRNREEAKNGDIVSNFLVIALALLPASIVSFIVREREDNLKHQQLITGVSLGGYWVSNAAMDIFKSMIPSSIAIGLIYAFDIDLPLGWLIVFLYAFTIIPFTYATSFVFTSENTAQTFTLMIHFFCGVILSPVFIILRMFDSTRDIGKILGWILRIIPSFSLSYGISNISYEKLWAALEKRPVADNLSLTVSGGDVLFLCLGFPIYWFIVYIIESQMCDCFIKCCEPSNDTHNQILSQKNAKVEKEEEKVRHMDPHNDPPAIIARNLRKLYRISATESTLAVDDVSFYVKKGECLALLGTNGAGKSTTFKMLTKDVIPSGGEILIKGLNFNESFASIRKLIGYCPQYESSYMSMTVRENLEFYAKIKGIPNAIYKPIIDKLIHEMNLTEYENVQAGQLSGGNKRKLTVAIALLGNPPIVLLDEPSTGVDPQAKRFMWHIIQRISTKSKNTAVVLTSHSMEEAEYLCTKMAIMVSGNFVCIGTPQELKEEFGKGFEIQISIPIPTPDDETGFIQWLNVFFMWI